MNYTAPPEPTLPSISGVNETAYWNLPNMTDQTNNSHDLTNQGTTTVPYYPPRSGSPESSYFDGSNYIESDDALDDIIDLSEDFTINLWTYGSLFLGTQGDAFLAVSDDGDSYMRATTGNEGRDLTVYLHEYLGNDLLWNYNLDGETLSSISPVHNDVLSAGDDYVYVGVKSEGSKLLMLDSTGSLVWELPGFTGGINDIATEDTSSGFVYVGDDERLHKVHPNGTSVYWSGTAEGPVHSVETHVDEYGGAYVFAGRDNSQVYKYDGNGNFYWNNSAHDGAVLDITTDGDYVYSVGEDNTVRKYDFDTGELLLTITNATDNTTGVVTAADALYVSSRDGKVREYDKTFGGMQWAYDTGSPVNTLATDGNWLYAGKENGQIDKLSLQGVHVWTDPNRYSSVIDDMEFVDQIFAVTPTYAYSIQENMTSDSLQGSGLIQGHWNMWSITRSGDNISLYSNTGLEDSLSEDFTLPLNGTFRLGRGVSYYKGYMDEVRLYNTSLPQGNLESLYWFADPNINVSDFLRVEAEDAITGETIYGFNVTESGSTSATRLDYLLMTGILKDLETSVDLTVNAEGYASADYNDYDPSTSGDLTAQLYPGNSVNITVYSIEDGTQIDDFGVQLFNEEASGEATFVDSTTDGTMFFDGLGAGNWLVNVEPTNESYSNVQRDFYITEGEVTELRVYLHTGETFTVNAETRLTDKVGAQDEVKVSMYAPVNGDWELIEERESQGTRGYAEFDVANGTSYRFTASEAGYYPTTKQFTSSELWSDFITTTGYRVFSLKLDPKPTVSSDIGDDVVVVMEDYYFREGEDSWIEVEFGTVSNNLITYGASFNVEEDGVACDFDDTVQTGSLETGGTLNLTCSNTSMTNLSFAAPVTVRACYVAHDVEGEPLPERCLTKQFTIKGDSDVSGIEGLAEATEGWGSLEKALVATLIIIGITAGLGLLGGVTGGAFGMLLATGFITYGLAWLKPWIFYLIALPVTLILWVALKGGKDD